MEKRLIFAISLSMLILLGWSMLTTKPVQEGISTQPIENKQVISENKVLPSSQIQDNSQILDKQKIDNVSTVKYENSNWAIVFIESSASIKEVCFKSYQNYKFSLEYGFLWQDQTKIFKKISESPESITFVSSDQTQKITKIFTFNNSNYTIGLDIKVQNISGDVLAIAPTLFLGILDYSSTNVQSRFQDVTVSTKEKVTHISGQKNKDFPDLNFISLRDRYFSAIVEPKTANYIGWIKSNNSHHLEVGLKAQQIILPAGQSIEQNFRIYLGPQDLKSINAIKLDWNVVIYYGTFDFISQILLQLLEFVQRIVHNWGWAIIIFSILIYLVLYPLSAKQMRAMKEMQALQPHIEELRVQYKDNPQKLNKELMELYKEHKVNPFGGCLPVLLQMPIFFALYQALMRSIALRGADFLWIKDLSEPDRLFTLPTALPFLGNEINILPIIMAIGMFFQQKLTTASSGGSNAEQQKMMLIVFPIIFGIIFYHMPAGLVLYWFINSALMLLNQVRANMVK